MPAELCLEADRLRIDETADITTLVRSKQMLWRPELERRDGRGSVLSGLVDTNPTARGIITGGVATATGVPLVVTVAAALVGGLITPMIRLFGNIRAGGRGMARDRAVSTHFTAMEG